MARVPIGWRRLLQRPARYPRVIGIDLDPSVPAVEQLLALATARSSEVPPTVGGRLSVSHALWLCACEAEESPTPAQKVALDELHRRKIDLADRVYVINPGGYLGDSTRREVEYARSHGKTVDFSDPR